MPCSAQGRIFFLTEQLGGLLKTGFILTDLYEDGDGGGLFDAYMNSYVAIRVVKK